MSQSPIQIHSEEALVLKEPNRLLEVQYKEGAEYAGRFEGEPGHKNFVLNDGPEVTLPLIRFRGTPYSLRKIHLHDKSEHNIDRDNPRDFEIHFIHAPQGSPVSSPLVVIGVLFELSGKQSRDCLGVQKLCKCLAEEGEISVNPLDFFPQLPGDDVDLINWFHYEGSLTSFPYSENVSWFVMKNSSSITRPEIEGLRAHASQHSREYQPLARRLVVRSFSTLREA